MNVEIDEFFSFCKRHKYLVASLIGLGFSAVFIRRYFAGGICRSNSRLEGKTVIITGGNTGIGKETAKDLAERGARVILACRDITKAERAAADIRSITHNENVLVRIVDLASLRSVSRFANEVLKTEEKIHILINNAGVMMCPYWQTEDGFEMQFGTNHLGHFLLTSLLLARIKDSAPARIINVSSLVHSRPVTFDFDHLNDEKTYRPITAYQQSKLANVLFTRELSKRLAGSGVTVNSIDPGVVDTELQRHLPAYLKLIIFLLRPLSKTPTEGAQTTIYCAVSEDLEGVTGKYFSDCAMKKEGQAAQDDVAAKKLWEISAKMVGLA